MLYSTFKNRDEAVSVARALLEARLIACANIHERVTSLYRWQGELQEETEAVMIAKTATAKVKAATDAIRHLHSYDTPCIVATAISGGHAPYLEWIAHETT